jgi:hypothetical protein
MGNNAARGGCAAEMPWLWADSALAQGKIQQDGEGESWPVKTCLPLQGKALLSFNYL